MPEPKRADWSDKAGIGCLILFAMPFALVGVGSLVKLGIMLWRGEAPGMERLLTLGAMGLCSSLVGFGLLFGILYHAGAHLREQSKKREMPDQPWLWKGEWAAGRLTSTTRREMIFDWILAIFWNALTTVAVVSMVQQITRESWYLSFLILPFVLAGGWLLFRAVRSTMRFRRFGRSIFEMAVVPGIIGGRLLGLIFTRFPILPEHGFRLRLVCVNCVRTDSETTTEKVLWESEHRVLGDVTGPRGRPGIPVVFDIPDVCCSSDDSDPDNVTTWRLETTADIPGIDFHAAFEVPVFRTAVSEVRFEMPIRERLAAVAPPAPGPDTEGPRERLVRQGISIRTADAGGMEILLAAARHKRSVLVVSAVCACWTGVFVAVVSSANVVLILMFGFFEFVFLRLALIKWFRSARIRVGRDGVSIAWRSFGLTRTLEVSRDNIQGFEMVLGENVLGKGYYDIRVNRRSTRTTLTAVDEIEGRGDAEWLAGEIRRTAGVEQPL